MSDSNGTRNGLGNKGRHQNGWPVNVDAERFVLGSILLGSIDFETVQRGLETDDFSLEKHRRIFSRMADLNARGEKIDRVTLAEELMRLDELNSVDGLSYLVSLDDGLPQIPNVDSYVNILRKKAALREIISVAKHLQESAFLEMDDPGALIASVRARLDGIENATVQVNDLMLELPMLAGLEVTTTYLVDELVPRNGITLWTGGYGSGKSTLALALANSVARGIPFLGRSAMRTPVLILDKENPLGCLKDRMLEMEISDADCPLRIWGMWHTRPPQGPETRDVIEFARKRKPLIIFDSLVTFAQCDENSADQMRAHMHWYRRLAAAGATVLLLHHASEKTGAAHNYRGSTAIPDAVDSAWVLSRDDETDASQPLGRVVLTPFKARLKPSKLLRIEYADGAFLPVDGPVRPAMEIVLELVASHPGATQKELRKLGPQHGVSDHKVVETVDAAVIAHKLEARRGKHNALRYYLPQAGLEASV